MKKKAYVLIVTAIFVAGFSLATPVGAVDWSDWTRRAVGDITENTLTNYWTFTSTPYSYPYDDNIWSSWGM